MKLIRVHIGMIGRVGSFFDRIIMWFLSLACFNLGGCVGLGREVGKGHWLVKGQELWEGLGYVGWGTSLNVTLGRGMMGFGKDMRGLGGRMGGRWCPRYKAGRGWRSKRRQPGVFWTLFQYFSQFFL